MDRTEAGKGRAWPWGLALGTTLLGAVLLGGLLRVELDTSTASFLPSGDPVEKALAAKSDDFGGDPVVVLLETKAPRVLFTDQEQLVRLIGLEGKLADLPDVAAVYGPGTVLNQTAGAAQDMLAQISGRRDGYRNEVMAAARKKGLTDAQVKRLGEAALARFDERYGSLMVQGLPAGLPTVKNPRFVQTLLFDPETLKARPQWRFLAPRGTTVAILVRPRASLDAEATSQLVDGVRRTVKEADLEIERTTITGSPAVAAGLGERGPAPQPVRGAVAHPPVTHLVFLSGWTQRRRALLRPIASALIGTAATLAAFGWAGQTVSLGVVAFLPILIGIGSDFPLYWSRGIADRAVLVAATAAAVGFSSLALSPLPFVRELGVALAIGLVFTVAAAALARKVFGPVPGPAGRSLVMARRGRWSTRARIGAACIVALSGVIGWIALAQMDVEAQPDRLAAGLPELQDAAHAEEILGSSGEVSVVVASAKVTDPDVLAWTKKVQERIVTDLGDRVHPVLSAADLLRFVGDHPSADQVDAAVAAIPPYRSSAGFKSDRSEALLVLGVEFDDVDELGELLDDLRSALVEPPEGVTVQAVGLPVSAARGLELVSESRLVINLAGIGAAGFVILVGLRSRRDAARTVLTIAVATGWVALIASASAGSLNPLTVAVGSLVTATGSEFAILLRRGRDPRTVATAALAGTVGYLTLALSELAVLRDFGLLLAVSVVCSFAAAYVVDGICGGADERDSAPGTSPVAQRAPMALAVRGNGGSRDDHDGPATKDEELP